ncbi:hypothetical protein G7046_g9236 [Stylonectria norvegica]|nr:hypothetical protein G7046_g9236 [Stylonectria norvegica]
MMYRSLAVLAGCLVATSVGAPLEKRAAATAAPPGGDIAILNYALALEYLERKFYQGGLEKFTDADFNAAGLTDFYKNLETIYADEMTHVTFLSTALGDKAIGEPTFSFPYTDVHSFIGLSSVLEGVGVSAYLGAAATIADKDYLTAAGSILTIEARHSSYIRNALGEKPFPTPFDTALDFNQVFSLAAQFITGLAPGTDLPFKAFPALATTGASSDGNWAGASPVVFTGAAKAAGKTDGVNAVFYSGSNVYYVPVEVQGDDFMAIIPGANYSMTPELAPSGQVYIVLSTADGKDVMASDENTIAGVAVIEVVE